MHEALTDKLHTLVLHMQYYLGRACRSRPSVHR